MKRMKDIKVPIGIAALLLYILAFVPAYSQDARLKITVEAPSEVEAGSGFQVVFVLNQEADHFSGPDFKGFEILGGPGYAESRFTSTINGKQTREVRITYTYAVKASNPGTYTIAPAYVRIGKTTYKSKATPVNVIGNTPQERSNASPEEPGGDLFIQNSLSNRKPYKGEVVILTQKLYTRLAIQNIGRPRLPSFNGFWAEPIETSNYQVKQEQFNGKLYNTIILNRTLLIPQRTGSITIEPSSVMIQRVVERTVNRQLWSGVIQQVVREYVDNEIRSSSLTLQVKELPSKGQPSSFRGAVGNFTLEASMPENTVEAGEPFELRVRINGSGNLKLLDAPLLQLPDDLEAYPPEISDKVNTGLSGMSGYRDFSYLIIPRDTGIWEIPGVEFSFFDPDGARYVQRLTGKLSVTAINPKNGKKYNTANMGKEDVKYFGRDIRYISLTYATPPGISLNPGSWPHLVLLAAPLLLFLGILLFYRKRVRLHADKDKMRALKAKSVAEHRLKQAYKALQENNDTMFYSAMLDALWGYAADKLGLKLSELNRGRVKEILEGKGVDTETMQLFSGLIDDCEFSKYAPSPVQYHKEKIYASAERCITTLEHALHRQATASA